MLEIKDLHASINGKEILKGINLTIRDGEVHALMGQIMSLICSIPLKLQHLYRWVFTFC